MIDTEYIRKLPDVDLEFFLLGVEEQGRQNKELERQNKVMREALGGIIKTNWYTQAVRYAEEALKECGE